MEHRLCWGVLPDASYLSRDWCPKPWAGWAMCSVVEWWMRLKMLWLIRFWYVILCDVSDSLFTLLFMILTAVDRLLMFEIWKWNTFLNLFLSYKHNIILLFFWKRNFCFWNYIMIYQLQSAPHSVSVWCLYYKPDGMSWLMFSHCWGA